MRKTYCVLILPLLSLAVAALGHADESRKPDDPSKVVRDMVRGEWRFPGEKLIRITGKVQVIDAHTLLYEDGTEVDLNGAMDAPELKQKGSIGEALYPCGQEAAEFLKKLIGDKPVTCFVDSGPGDESKKIRQAEAFVAETNLNNELVRNGWAMAHHSGMAAWEAIARGEQARLVAGRLRLSGALA